MNDIQFLFAILGGLYLWECANWLRRGGISLSSWLGRDWRLRHPAVMLGNQTGGLVFAAPLPPLGSMLFAFQPPVSLGPDGIVWFTANNINPGWRPAQTAQFLDWKTINNLQLRGKKLLLEGKVVHRAPTTTRAGFLFRTLTETAKLPANRRGENIQLFLRASLDEKAIQSRWDTFRTKTKTLRRLTNFLFGLVFILAPGLIGLIGLQLVWLWLVLALLALTISTAVCFARLHRQFWPEAADDRFTQTLLIALAPATTMRALDIASRPLLENFHPLAVAKVFLQPAAFRRFARRGLLDLRHPIQPTCPNPQPEAVATEAFFRRTQLEIIESWLEENKLPPTELCKAPDPADESCRAFCPRCEAQFTATSGQCTDCGGLPLIAFPKAS